MASLVGNCIPCSPVPRSVRRALGLGGWRVQSLLPRGVNAGVVYSDRLYHTGSHVICDTLPGDQDLIPLSGFNCALQNPAEVGVVSPRGHPSQQPSD